MLKETITMLINVANITRKTRKIIQKKKKKNCKLL